MGAGILSAIPPSISLQLLDDLATERLDLAQLL